MSQAGGGERARCYPRTLGERVVDARRLRVPPFDVRCPNGSTMIVRKAQAASLQLLKMFVGRKPLTLRIWDGPLKRYKWTFDATSNNEVILGIWEANMQALYARYLRPGDVVFDLGAHQGFLAMLAARLVGDQGHVYALEASPTNASRMRRNLQLNGVSTCTAIHAAVGDRNGTVEFSNSAHDNANTYLRSSPYFTDQPTVIVPAVSLDECVRTRGFRLPDFIKCDVEGAELDALKGAEGVLTEKRPLLYLETHNIHNPGVEDRCLDYLRDMGYRTIEVIDQTADRSMSSYVMRA
jgi:FkbM family methyltransferase